MVSKLKLLVDWRTVANCFTVLVCIYSLPHLNLLILFIVFEEHKLFLLIFEEYMYVTHLIMYLNTFVFTIFFSQMQKKTSSMPNSQCGNRRNPPWSWFFCGPRVRCFNGNYRKWTFRRNTDTVSPRCFKGNSTLFFLDLFHFLNFYFMQNIYIFLFVIIVFKKDKHLLERVHSGTSSCWINRRFFLFAVRKRTWHRFWTIFSAISYK